jgi:integrase
MTHLWKRGKTYYAQLNVPKDVQKALGQAKLAQTLKTDSETEANRRARPIIAHWKELIENARGNTDLSVRARVWRETLRKTGSEEEASLLKELITDEAYDLEAEGLPFREIKQFHDAATGKRTPLKEYLEKHLADLNIEDKSKAERRSAFDQLEARYNFLEDIDRRTASDFLDDVLRPGKAPATVNKKIMAYIGYWKWLRKKGYLPLDFHNPWTEQSQRPKRGDELQRRAFTEEEAGTFMKIAASSSYKYPDDLSVALVMAVTGMRLEEVCSLDQEDVSIQEQVTWLDIKEGKTDAAARRVPVVEPEVIAELRQRHNGASGPLFPTLTETKYGDRSPAISKRLNRHLRNISKDPALVAGHSWRHRARSLMEHGGIVPWVCDWFIGHARPGEGLSRYSKPSDDQLVEAAKAVSLPS